MRLFFAPRNLSFPANAIDALQAFSCLGFRRNLGILCLEIEQLRLVWPASRSPASRGLGRRCLGRSACTRCKLGRARSRPRIGEGKRCARLRCRLRCQWHAGCCQDRCVSRKNPHDTRRVTAGRSRTRNRITAGELSGRDRIAAADRAEVAKRKRCKIGAIEVDSLERCPKH